MRNLFFPTPVWASNINNYKDVNEEIYNYILELKKNNPKGIKKSNFKGWHSENFNLQDSAVKNFVQMILTNINESIKDMNWNMDKQLVKIQSMWAIINEKGAFNERHHHGNSTLSCAYYVRAPQDCGQILFYDPRPAPVFFHPYSENSNTLNASVNSITPNEGTLVIFPSYLEHSVNPNLSEDERIVISFNIIITNK